MTDQDSWEVSAHAMRRLIAGIRNLYIDEPRSEAADTIALMPEIVAGAKEGLQGGPGLIRAAQGSLSHITSTNWFDDIDFAKWAGRGRHPGGQMIVPKRLIQRLDQMTISNHGGFDQQAFDRFGHNHWVPDYNPKRPNGGNRMVPAIEYLKSWRPLVELVHKELQPIDSRDVPGLRLDKVTPLEHQLQFVTQAERLSKSLFQGAFLADPPGLGKTLSVLMLLARAAKNAAMPCIVVLPPAIVQQWWDEIHRYFEEGALRVKILDGSSMSPHDIAKCDIVMMTYHFLVAQMRKRDKLREELIDLNKTMGETPRRSDLPKRPDLNVLSELFDWCPIKFPWLVLDEATAIKNPSAQVTRAVYELANNADFVLQMTGSLVDNSYEDLIAHFGLLGHHAFWDVQHFRNAFCKYDTALKQWQPPDNELAPRLVSFMAAFVIRRPKTILNLPPLTHEMVRYEVEIESVAESDRRFFWYQRLMRNAALVRYQPGQAAELRQRAYRNLTKATLYAAHPALVRLYKHASTQKQIKAIEISMFRGEMDTSFAERKLSEAQQSSWPTWKEELSQNEYWRSGKVDAVVSTINLAIDRRSTASILVFDNNLYFLDIVRIALRQSPEGVKIFRFSGRQSMADRTRTLEAFRTADTPKVMLTSISCGGLGLNMAWCDTVIMCGPQLKKTDEEQAIDRVHRKGCQKPVTVYHLRGNSYVDEYKSKRRDDKEAVNICIRGPLTQPLHQAPPLFDDDEHAYDIE